MLPPTKTESANQSPKERDRSEDESKGWVRWEVSHEQLKHETRAYAGSFGDYEARDDIPPFAELYDGVVAVSTDDPGIARAHAEARFTMRFPEATCESYAIVKLDSDRDTYRLAIELTVSEDDDVLWVRRWDREIPRDHQ